MTFATLSCRTRLLSLGCAAMMPASPAVSQNAGAEHVLSMPKTCRSIETPDVRRHVARANLLIGRNLPQGLIPNLFIAPRMAGYCPPSPVPQVTIDNSVAKPIRAFDNLFYVGSRFVGAWALKTSAGVILFDAMWSEADAANIIEPGLRSIGIEPRDIKYLVITHGHLDHSGGARHFQQVYGTKILLGRPDIPLLNIPSAPGLPVAPAPEIDRPIDDGDALTLGNVTVRFYITPGHTPGSVAAIFPVTDNGSKHVVTLFGGYGLPSDLRPDRGTPSRHGGVDEYIAQIERFRAIGRSAGADVAISTHPIFDDTVQKGATPRRLSEKNPWVIGRTGWLNFTDANLEVARAFQSMLRAAAQRSEAITR